MNPGCDNNHASIYYYDSDYPAPWNTKHSENFDATTEYQGLAHDIERYLEIARKTEGPVLELCCGTGRVALPLAREGHSLTGVDFSGGMLDRFRRTLAGESYDVRRRLQLVQQDITELSLERADFRLAIIAFNSLLCIPDFRQQLEALKRTAAHLSSGGMLVLDIINPLVLPISGDPVPKPFFTRKDVNSGRTYTRFAMMGPFDAQHRQQLHGWYDEMDAQGVVRRRQYSLIWRPIFRYEIELMLEQAGFRLEGLEGGHRKEPYTAQSPRMFLQATRL